MLDHPHYQFVKSFLDHVYKDTKPFRYKIRSLDSRVIAELIKEIIFRDHYILLDQETIKLVFTTFLDIVHIAFLSQNFDVVDIPYIGRLSLKYNIRSINPLCYSIRHSVRIKTRYNRRFINGVIQLAEGNYDALFSSPKAPKHRKNKRR